MLLLLLALVLFNIRRLILLKASLLFNRKLKRQRKMISLEIAPPLMTTSMWVSGAWIYALGCESYIYIRVKSKSLAWFFWSFSRTILRDFLGAFLMRVILAVFTLETLFENSFEKLLTIVTDGGSHVSMNHKCMRDLYSAGHLTLNPGWATSQGRWSASLASWWRCQLEFDKKIRNYSLQNRFTFVTHSGLQQQHMRKRFCWIRGQVRLMDASYINRGFENVISLISHTGFSWCFHALS